MDALARVEPVARPLLRAVDDALVGFGAPSDHPIWPLLRRVAATPADAVDHIADADPERLRSVAAALRAEAEGHAGVGLPTDGWEGGAGAAFAVRAGALAAHLRDPGPESLVGRLHATASYVDDVGDWQRRSRDRVAVALADVLGSAQAASLRGLATPSTSDGLTPGGPVAADIGACVLAAVAESLDEGERLADDWTGRLDELAYRAPAEPTTTADERIHLRH